MCGSPGWTGRLVNCGNPSKTVFSMASGYRGALAEKLAALEVWKFFHYSQVYLSARVMGK